MKKFIALTVVAFTLASCGGSGGGGGALGPTSRDVGSLPSGFVATYDAATDQVVLTIDGAEVARLDNDGSIGTGFASYVGDGPVVLYAETISGDGAVFAVIRSSGEGAQVARLGETDLPSSGSAIFNGEYAGFFLDTGSSFSVPIVGDAQLIADFASASISGEITNRDIGQNAADDITLLSTAITSAGAFSGTTTGGDRRSGGVFAFDATTAFNGEYVGLIVGDTGNEVVGGVSLLHLGFLGESFLETGAFVAAE